MYPVKKIEKSQYLFNENKGKFPKEKVIFMKKTQKDLCYY